jgi:hypothetical protein
MIKLRTVASLLPLFLSSFALADLPENVDVYGFITQGYFKSSANNFYGPSSNGSLEFTELGAGISVIANDRLSVSGMLLARHAGEADDGNIRVDHLVFDFATHRGNHSQSGVRLGRNKIPFGFYNATRDMAFTRPTLLLPQSVYHDHSRNFLINADGMDAYFEHWSNGNYTKLDLLYEKTNGIDNPQTETYYMGMDWPGSLSSDFATGVVLNHSFNNNKTRFAAYAGHLPVNYSPSTFDPLPAGKITTDVAWLSIQHEVLPKVTITSEAFLPRIEYNNLSPYMPSQPVYPLGWYLQATYAQSVELELYARFDQSYRDKHDKNGEKSSALTGRPSHAFYASDWTIGLNYFPSANWMVSAEFHHINGTTFLPVLDNPDPTQTQARWNLLGIQATYRFK